jgi:glutamate/tyrosine decarboxylase-like PLP-dependent enzyme
MHDLLETLASVASILTAAVTVSVSAYYWFDHRKKQKKLEGYLKAEQKQIPARQTHTALDLMAKLGLTKAEILKASFTSQHIVRKEHVNDDTKLTEDILFEYHE